MSRLLENSEQLREQLEARNLYQPDRPYNLDNGQVIDTINALASVLKPFSSFDLTNTVVGRLIGEPTPIAQIGLQMLAKQFAATVASNASAEFLPSIKFNNLFDGNPETKFLMRKKDFQITRRETQTNLGRILDAISGVNDYFNTGSPFQSNPTSADYVRNSGKGQLQSLVENTNRNIYKLEDSGVQNALKDDGLQVTLGDTLVKTKTYYIEQGSKFYPFGQYINNNAGLADVDYRDTEAFFLQGTNTIGVKEYGGSQEYLDGLGDTFYRDNSNAANNYNFESENFGLNDNTNEQLVWGRDGAADYYKESLGDLVESDDEVASDNPRFSNVDQIERFGIRTGLLNYTKNLLNAKGKYASFDLTRKKFQDTNGQLHFNGSPLDTEPDGTINYSRRHSIADPYDKYAKAIRFNGNRIYNGNEDSVIYNSVIPKFAPSQNTELVDNRNLMFSIENLAAEVIKDEQAGVAYIKDEMATSLPMCEAGPNNGRLMWFPPYDIKINETAVARWDATSFIGRGEPIYTYSNSERLANLSFKMLVDYPEQLLNYRQEGESDFHKLVSEFFAFGGEAIPEFDTNLSQKEALLAEKQKAIKDIEPNQLLVEPNVPTPNDINIYFINDRPTVAGTDNGVEEILFLGYEDGEEDPKEVDGVDYGLNKPFIENFGALDDYTSDLIDSLFNPDNGSLYNEKGDPYLKIVISAGATKLYNSQSTGISESEYNKALSVRRQLATKAYLERVIKETLGQTAQQLKIKISTPNSEALGSTQSSDSFDTPSSIADKGAKLERFAKISFVRDSKVLSKVEVLTEDQKNEIKDLKEEIAALQGQIRNIKKRMRSYNPCTYEPPSEEDGIEKGFKSAYSDRFYPVFHTQTPEDFHRRLTFLHQCTRQGPAIRVVSNGITSSKNSVFGRQPICILRFGDFFHTKIVIDQISFDYGEATWDLNPEGRGMQPMLVDVSMQIKIIGGQSLKTPIDALQNAVSFNYYANSTFTKSGLYSTPALVEAEQNLRNEGLKGLTAREKEELARLRNEKNNRLSELYAITPNSVE